MVHSNHSVFYFALSSFNSRYPPSIDYCDYFPIAVKVCCFSLPYCVISLTFQLQAHNRKRNLSRGITFLDYTCERYFGVLDYIHTFFAERCQQRLRPSFAKISLLWWHTERRKHEYHQNTLWYLLVLLAVHHGASFRWLATYQISDTLFSLIFFSNISDYAN